MSIPWADRYSVGGREMKGSSLRAIFSQSRKPGMISLAGGTPAPEVFPVEEIAAASEHALTHHTIDALQYGPTEGYTPLKEYLVTRMARYGMPCTPNQIHITAGSQQGSDLVGRLFIDPGSVVAIEDPTYASVLTSFAPYQPKYVPLPMDENGVRIDALEQLLKSGVRPAFFYTVSSFQNPTGVSISIERRRQLVEMAARYAMPIVEDDPYGELVFEGEVMPPIAAIDAQMHGSVQHVIYMSTFSKLLSPGLRVAWIVAPQEVVDKLILARQGMDLHTTGLSQVIAHELCADGFVDRHIPRIRETYRARRDAMLEALAQYMPSGIHWNKPRGGMFVWMTLPPEMDSTKLVAAAIQKNVVFMPGIGFYANGGPLNTARLSFANPTPDAIRNGVQRLAETIREYHA